MDYISEVCDGCGFEWKYPDVHENLTELLNKFDSLNHEETLNLRRLLMSKCLEDFKKDFKGTTADRCISELQEPREEGEKKKKRKSRFSSGKLEDEVCDIVFRIINYSGKAENLDMATRLMVLLGYESYKIMKDRFRQRMENKLRALRNKGDSSVRKSSRGKKTSLIKKERSIPTESAIYNDKEAKAIDASLFQQPIPEVENEPFGQNTSVADGNMEYLLNNIRGQQCPSYVTI